jgi:hypothetical protein
MSGYSVYRVNQLEGHLKRLENDMEKINSKQEAVELLVAYAQDIVDAWPNLTMRTLSTMTARVNTLRQALEEVKK